MKSFEIISINKPRTIVKANNYVGAFEKAKLCGLAVILIRRLKHGQSTTR